jgi:hypothetical protein
MRRSASLNDGAICARFTRNPARLRCSGDYYWESRFDPRDWQRRAHHGYWPPVSIRIDSDKGIPVQLIALERPRLVSVAVELIPYKMKIRKIVATTAVILLFGCRAASAERCVILSGPRYNLVADAISWSMRIASGHHCVRGVRFANVEFESVTLISSPQSGQVVLQGWGFTYTAQADFRGEDSFALEVSGRIKKVRGTSTIQILVSVVGNELPDAR